jgi:hypothetical protein
MLRLARPTWKAWLSRNWVAVFVSVFIFVHEVLLYALAIGRCSWPAAPPPCAPGARAAPLTRNAAVPAPPLRLLLTSDPQLQGNLWEPPVLRQITTRDADWHLWKVMGLALRWLRPDAVLVLGDLLDEGFVASDADFEAYAARYRSIFRIPTRSAPANGTSAAADYTAPPLSAAGATPVVSIAGDNDIGGEGGDVMEARVLRRFEREFGSVNGGVALAAAGGSAPPQRFAKVNTLAFERFNSVKFRTEAEAAMRKIGSPRRGEAPPVLLSHYPLRAIFNRADADALLRAVQPRCVISGHTHALAMVRESYLSGGGADVVDREGDGGDGGGAGAAGGGTNGGGGNRVRHGVREFTVPTMSYRMGTASVGISMAVISAGCAADAMSAAEAGDGIAFATCWLPSRYPSLMQYALLGLFLLLRQMTRMCCPTARRKKRQTPSALPASRHLGRATMFFLVFVSLILYL